ncbi:MAG: hypothetical protein J3R72DRAFT_477088 [Linnemannia gamsii]|nr:MAG: hypothetical protein J3R72DRAFT_477088 [Linnemannia gamsii]
MFLSLIALLAVLATVFAAAIDTPESVCTALDYASRGFIDFFPFHVEADCRDPESCHLERYDLLRACSNRQETLFKKLCSLAGPNAGCGNGKVYESDGKPLDPRDDPKSPKYDPHHPIESDNTYDPNNCDDPNHPDNPNNPDPENPGRPVPKGPNGKPLDARDDPKSPKYDHERPIEN